MWDTLLKYPGYMEKFVSKCQTDNKFKEALMELFPRPIDNKYFVGRNKIPYIHKPHHSTDKRRCLDLLYGTMFTRDNTNKLVNEPWTHKTKWGEFVTLLAESDGLLYIDIYFIRFGWDSRELSKVPERTIIPYGIQQHKRERETADRGTEPPRKKIRDARGYCAEGEEDTVLQRGTSKRKRESNTTDPTGVNTDPLYKKVRSEEKSMEE
jgi:hypothetical protein